MLHSEKLEELICLVSVLDRPTLLRRFREVQAPFPIDLTNEYLESLPLDSIRHIFLALCLQCRHSPAACDAEAVTAA